MTKLKKKQQMQFEGAMYRIRISRTPKLKLLEVTFLFFVDSVDCSRMKITKITYIKNSSLNTYCWRSAFQLGVTGINQFALLTTNSNCGVLTEAETSHCQQCASWETNESRWWLNWAVKWITINLIFIALFIWKCTQKFKKHKKQKLRLRFSWHQIRGIFWRKWFCWLCDKKQYRSGWSARCSCSTDFTE